MSELVPAVQPSPRPLRKIDAVCVDVVWRTHDTVSLFFATADMGPYRAGQFISIDPHQFPELARWTAYLEKEKGRKELIRAYSMESAPRDPYIAICVKAEPYDQAHEKYPPLLSPFLVSNALKDRKLVFSGYTGAYVLDDKHAENTSQVLHLCAGSGIVPNYAILKDELQKPQNASVKHTLLYVNKTLADIIYKPELDALQQAHPDRFELIHLITREDVSTLGSRYLPGRPTTEIVKKHIHDVDRVRVFACGAAITRWQRQKAKEQGVEPAPRFMETVESIIHELGIPKPRFKKEEYG